MNGRASATITKNDIVSILKDKNKNSHVGLPRDIEFSIQDDILKVFIKKPTLNMQSNSAAFEGWITALKACLSDLIKKVELDYSKPIDLPTSRFGTPKICHFNRFLYRINNFARIFPEWFVLSDDKIDEVERFMTWLRQGQCYLNHSLQERKSVIETDKQERQIESWLTFEEGKEDLCKLWGLDKNKLFNQLPVGVFYQQIAKNRAVFTRGAGAIDLWGVSEDGLGLHIIELKCGDNIGMGVISEVLFYTAVIYDTSVVKDFKLGKYKDSPDTTDMLAFQNAIQTSERLYSHILSERYHPLFSDDVTELLKRGLSKLHITFDREKYDYKKKKLPV